jgi:GR25 family glycosyltransferase involved in LPS biosynthesis
MGSASAQPPQPPQPPPSPQQSSMFAPAINEAVVINLDKRTDRYQSFSEFHSYMSSNIKRHSATYGLELRLTPEIKHLFRNNDFKWKKAVMGCALSHNQIWSRLAQNPDDKYSCLILEDDVRFYPKWQEVWAQAAPLIPDDADIIYLGGILPPNKAVFINAIELVNMHFSKVIPNEIFSPGNPRRYFHSCNYAYIMFARGARKLAKIIEEKGIFTSGDHMIVNHMDQLNVYFIHPIVAGCFQDLDPIYQKSQFNNFQRVDNFDSDLWNNVECFTPEEISSSIKQTEINDTMVDGINVECNAILLKLSQGKIDEMIQMGLHFFEKEFSAIEIKERDYNWLRVIQQVFISQQNKISNSLITEVIQKLTIYATVTSNIILKKIAEEIIFKYNEDIIARPPAVAFYPSINFQKKPYPIWYFSNNQQNKFLEREWLEEIIGKPVEFMAHGTKEIPISQKVSFLLLQKWESVQDMVLEKLNDLHANKRPAVLIHLSDEHCNDDISIYNHPAVNLVIRNYVRPDAPVSNKIITIPLGYVKNRSLKGKYRKLSNRKLIWSFAGSVDKPSRVEMLQTLSVIEPNLMKLLPTWKQPQPEEADEYLKSLEDTRFIPCARGQNFETYRLYEALEAGCIPICIGDPNNEHDCYNKLIGDRAILIVQDWSAVKSMIQQLNNNPQGLDQIQENLVKYWTNHKANITAHILAALERIALE